MGVEQAPKDDDYVVAANYALGADAARTRAIELFKQIVREAPKSEFATYATLILPRLQSKLDTGQRQYYGQITQAAHRTSLMPSLCLTERMTVRYAHVLQRRIAGPEEEPKFLKLEAEIG